MAFKPLKQQKLQKTDLAKYKMQPCTFLPLMPC